MHIILTHEQADFDAAASLLGAYLLHPNSQPVLPRRLNRNVRSFLNLYGANLPFIEAQDLPAEDIESVTLVDTQSLVTLKGMSQRTKIHVVDHHERKPDIPSDWIVELDGVGACTTLFVESLMSNVHEHTLVLNTTYATLLLMGIYEDTGSLAYISTTPRDVWAVGFLLEQGASLGIANEYLNPPLSNEQRELYEKLLNHAVVHTINGHNIILACADALGLDEEVSSVAHKLRDILDLDALFILVKTVEGIRMVARSTTDKVDVAKIAAHLGGGGHRRAAAALLRPEDLPKDVPPDQIMDFACQQIVEILPKYTHPAVVVEQVMSPQPILLAPNTSAQDAAKLMQRYGYEGYPVVKSGKVIGLLTRRAVDRAIAHRLNLPASSLMEAGEVTVHPQDSVEVLQRIMMETGWGQVPVVDPVTQKVIGIVTRTDLLKAMTPEARKPSGKQNLASRLEKALACAPSRLRLLKAVADLGYQKNVGVYIVGGFVRDLLLDRPSIDFDFVIEGEAIDFVKILAQKYGGRLVSHSRFGTAKWWIADIHAELREKLNGGLADVKDDLPNSLDFISARTEFYEYPTALPTVRRSSIKLDLHRRDFTINTMALRLDGPYYGDLVDYWGGLHDLKRGVIRVLHSLSFVDDPTRLLRAIRFEQRFQFQIEPHTYKLMQEAKSLLQEVSPDRLRHELDLILNERQCVAILKRLDSFTLLAEILPGLTFDADLGNSMETAIANLTDPEWNLPKQIGRIPIRQVVLYLIWMTRFSEDFIRKIARRLHFTADLKELLITASQIWFGMGSWNFQKPSQVTAFLDKYHPIVLYAVNVLCNTFHIYQEQSELIMNYIRSWRGVRPYTTGNDLRKIGLSPGPAYKTILEHLRAAWLDQVVNSMEEEKELLHRLLQDKEVQP